MSEWISVKDRLPKHGDAVCVCFGHDRIIGMARFYGGPGFASRWIDTIIGTTEFTPTHWQPLPDPPPKPDAFDEWWESLHAVKGDPALRWIPQASTRMCRGHAKVVWDAALASKRD